MSLQMWIIINNRNQKIRIGENTIVSSPYICKRKHCMVNSKQATLGYYRFDDFTIREIKLCIESNVLQYPLKQGCDGSNIRYIEKDGYQEFNLYSGIFGLM